MGGLLFWSVAFLAVPFTHGVTLVAVAAAPVLVPGAGVAGTAATGAAGSTALTASSSTAASTIIVGSSAASTGGATATAAVTAVGNAGAAASSASAGSGLTAGALAALPSGPVGWLVVGGVIVGAEVSIGDASMTATWDCWKPILRNSSSDPSQGMFLSDLLLDKRVKEWGIRGEAIELKNIWNDEFRLKQVTLPWDAVALHAFPLKAST